jgi:small subunit ribosomal protein S9
MAEDEKPVEPERGVAGDQPLGEAGEEQPAAEPEAEAPAAEPEADTPAAEPEAEEAEAPAAEEAEAPAAEPTADVQVEGDAILTDEELEDEVDETPRVKPEIPGADLEVDIVREDDRQRGEYGWSEEEDEEDVGESGVDADEAEPEPIPDAAIDLAAGARYTATGKRKTAVARVILKPGTGAYLINGRELDVFFPRHTLQRNIRQPLEQVGYDTRMDVVATMHGGGVSAQAGALRHGISRALIEADPNLRSELKRRGFLTRDARVKERKKAGLKKARKRPQFSKR